MDKETTKIKLDKLLKQGAGITDPRRNVVYGVYDSSGQGILTRIDDFFIDHSHVSLQEKAYFFHLLAVMIDSGISVMQAMNILAGKTGSVRFARILNTIAANLKRGVQLSQAMSHFPDVFGEMELGVVKSGEAAGNLDKMLFKLASELDKSNTLQIKLVTASIYPTPE